MSPADICEGSGETALTLGSSVTWSGFQTGAAKYIAEARNPWGRGETAECSWCRQTISVNLNGKLAKHREPLVPIKRKETAVAVAEEDIVHAYQKGASINEIVQRFNLTGPPSVYAVLARAKSRPSSNGEMPSPTADEDALKEGIRADFEAGMPFTDIRAKHGIGTGRLRDLIEKMGLERAPIGRKVEQPDPEPIPPDPEPGPIPEPEPEPEPVPVGAADLTASEMAAIQQYQEGRSTTEIQTEFKISPGQLYRILGKAGIKPGRAKGRPAVDADEAANAALADVDLAIPPREDQVRTGLKHYRAKIVVAADVEVLASDFFKAIQLTQDRYPNLQIDFISLEEAD